ncbi:MAG: lytic transglycosylase, partial [Desulfobacterales bacterium]|nr:lytic transglycosylase [Desulfobacterales bacterium]
MTRSPELSGRLSIFVLIIAGVCAFTGMVCHAAQPHASLEQAERFPVYDLIKPNVTFWTDIFTIYTRGQALVHDMGDLSRIYEEIKLNPAKTKDAARANKETKKKALKK